MLASEFVSSRPTDEVKGSEEFYRVYRSLKRSSSQKKMLDSAVQPNRETADFHVPLESRPLIVFVDGPVHLKTNQMIKDEETRTLLRKRGFRILELYYQSYSDKKRDQLFQEVLAALGCHRHCSAR